MPRSRVVMRIEYLALVQLDTTLGIDNRHINVKRKSGTNTVIPILVIKVR